MNIEFFKNLVFEKKKLKILTQYYKDIKNKFC